MGENDHSAWQLAVLQWFLQHTHAFPFRMILPLQMPVDRARAFG
jgi:hypothetical protein